MRAQFSMIGRLGGDAECVYGADGTSYARMRIATTRWNKATQSAETSWFSVSGNVPEKLIRHLTKGSLVFVDGSIARVKRDDQWYTNFYASTVRLLGSRRNGAAEAEAKAEVEAEAGQAARGDDEPGDDVPF